MATPAQSATLMRGRCALGAVALMLACSDGRPADARDAGGSRATMRACTANAAPCPALRIAGDEAEAELGFRFGAPRDTDGDGWLDVVAGARFASTGAERTGRVSVWSGKDAQQTFDWRGSDDDALFGHSTLLVPDLDGDGLADLIVSAPHSRDGAAFHGAAMARSPSTGRVLWRTEGHPDETFGWHLELTDDRTGDGVPELLVGSPHGPRGGRVAVLDSRRGTVLASIAGGADVPEFGWYVASIEDVDGDGLADILVGAPAASPQGLREAGAALLMSSASGRELLRIEGDREGAMLGEVVTALDDVDGDGREDIAVSATHARSHDGPLAGEVRIYSSRDGSQLDHLVGREAGELYGRFVGRAPDLDGDGTSELAIGAPWATGELGERQGRFEIRSGSDRALLFEGAGANADAWCGWHIAPAPPRGGGEDAPGVIVASLRAATGGHEGAGGLDWYVWRSDPPRDR